MKNKLVTFLGTVVVTLVVTLLNVLEVAWAQSVDDVDFAKVNAVIETVLAGDPLAEGISDVTVKLDESSDLSSLETAQVGMTLSATADEATWSAKPTTLDAKAELESLSSNASLTKVGLNLDVNAKTDALALYSYLAQVWLKESLQGATAVSADEQDLFDLISAAATQTASLQDVSEQLQRFVVVISDMMERSGSRDALSVLVSQLEVVETKDTKDTLTSVTLKTTSAMNVNFFGLDLEISRLAFQVTEGNVSFGADLKVLLPTDEVAELVLENIKQGLSLLENADANMIESIREMAQSYAGMVSELVNP